MFVKSVAITTLMAATALVVGEGFAQQQQQQPGALPYYYQYMNPQQQQQQQQQAPSPPPPYYYQMSPPPVPSTLAGYSSPSDATPTTTTTTAPVSSPSSSSSGLVVDSSASATTEYMTTTENSALSSSLSSYATDVSSSSPYPGATPTPSNYNSNIPPSYKFTYPTLPQMMGGGGGAGYDTSMYPPPPPPPPTYGYNFPPPPPPFMDYQPQQYQQPQYQQQYQQQPQYQQLYQSQQQYQPSYSAPNLNGFRPSSLRATSHLTDPSNAATTTTNSGANADANTAINFFSDGAPAIPGANMNSIMALDSAAPPSTDPSAPATSSNVNSNSSTSTSSSNSTGSNASYLMQSVGTNITVSSTVFGIIFIVVGFVFVFFGHMLFKPILFVAGFSIFSLASYSIMVAIEVHQGTLLFGNSRAVVFDIIIIVCGLIGGALMVCLWRLGLSAIGAMFGFFLSLWILSLIPTGSATALTTGPGRIIFLVSISLVFAIAIHFLERPLLIIGTAFPGSYQLFFGIDVFTRVGFAASTISFLNGNGFNNGTGTPGVSVAVYGFLGGVAALGVIGCAVQFLFSSRNKYKNKRHYKNIDTQNGAGVANKV